MNREQWDLHQDVKRLAIAMEKLVRLVTKLVKDNG